MPPFTDIEQPAWSRESDVEPAPAPRLRSPASFAHNLPVQLTTFIGRESEMAQVRALLAGSRLVTLTGAGGVGKTRLALQVAAELPVEFPAGVWLVDLAPLADPALVPVTAAHSLGLPDQIGVAAMATVAGFIGERRALIVLDNCEHLVEACAELAEELLRACPGLVILATSREPVGAAGEASWQVPPLPVDGDAVALFADRGQRARPGFVVSPENGAAVTDICRRLDGIPLAIELAAARLRAFSPAEIAAGLHDRFRLLTGGARTAVRRQQTLRASVDWSHALLAESERVLLRRLAVFAGGFDLDAAAAVCAGDGLDQHRVLEELVSLVDKSLVVAEEFEGVTSYRMLETVREYALEKLGDSGQANTVRTRHGDHYTALAARLAPPSSGDLGRQIARMEADIDNLRAAFQWNLELADSEAALRLASSLQPLWLGRSRQLEGVAWFDAALAGQPAGGETVAPAVWVRAVTDAAVLDQYTDSPLRRRAEIENSVALAREIGDPVLQSRALAAAGCIALLYRDDGQQRLEQALELARQAGETWTLTQILAWQAYAAFICGDSVATRSAAEEAIALAEQTGDREMSHRCRTWLARALLWQGELQRARSLHEELVAEAVAERSQMGQLLGLAGLGITFAFLGLPGEASAAGRECIAIADGLGDSVRKVDGTYSLAYGAMASGDPGTLREASEACWHLLNVQREAWILPPLVTEDMRRFIAEAHLAQGDLAAARHHAGAAVAAASRPGAKFKLMQSLLASARVADDEGDTVRAQDEAYQALAMGHTVLARIGIIDALECLGGLATGGEDHSKGARLLGAADTLRHATGYQRFRLHQARYDSAVQTLRTALGDAAFTKAWDEGVALSLDEAVSYALRGRGERGRPATGWNSLTPAEREVALLVADGLTNKEIAARLFVSPRTVQTHLTHMYSKLGVTSRVQLAQLAARRN
jgi:predicted ATPase/DNA-binding CsgD family transcriptional regulator